MPGADAAVRLSDDGSTVGHVRSTHERTEADPANDGAVVVEGNDGQLHRWLLLQSSK